MTSIERFGLKQRVVVRFRWEKRSGRKFGSRFLLCMRPIANSATVSRMKTLDYTVSGKMRE